MSDTCQSPRYRDQVQALLAGETKWRAAFCWDCGAWHHLEQPTSAPQPEERRP